MQHPANVSVGVATHTGRVRRVNEDDYLLCAPQTTDEAERMGWIVAIAAARLVVRNAPRVFIIS